jgi:DNA topoisomerase VI subunit B
VILKELVDNALDAYEEVGVAPVIGIVVSTDRGEIVIRDNGPGIPVETVAGILDYSLRASSREAYCSPCRGAQGNAAKTIVAMAFALDGNRGETIIEARGINHRIVFGVDQVRQEPRIDHTMSAIDMQRGTKITVRWPDSARSILEGAKERFVQIADDFAWLNPHLTLYLSWNDVETTIAATNDGWSKWRACDPTSAHWYDVPRLERYIAAHIARDQDTGRERMVREFISELDGLTRSNKQKAVLADVGAARTSLSEFFGSGEQVNRTAIAQLLKSCQANTRPVKPEALGLIGEPHLRACFQSAAVHEKTFKYQRTTGETDGLPWVIETAFGYCPGRPDRRRIIAGVNFSVGIGNPFRSFRRYGGEGLEALLNRQRAAADEPIVFVLHYTCPRVDYSDRGKTGLIIPGVGGL